MKRFVFVNTENKNIEISILAKSIEDAQMILFFEVDMPENYKVKPVNRK